MLGFNLTFHCEICDYEKILLNHDEIVPNIEEWGYTSIGYTRENYKISKCVVCEKWICKNCRRLFCDPQYICCNCAIEVKCKNKYRGNVRKFHNKHRITYTHLGIIENMLRDKNFKINDKGKCFGDCDHCSGHCSCKKDNRNCPSLQE